MFGDAFVETERKVDESGKREVEKLKWRYSITGSDSLAWRWYIEDEQQKPPGTAPIKTAQNYNPWEAKALLRQHKDTL